MTTVYTDGACIGNPGPGGWAWAVAGGAFASGADPDTTNQKMELTAALEAVGAHAGPLTVITDSKYVVDCFAQQWYVRWEAKGWRGANRQPVANQKLWMELLAAYRGHDGPVTFEWVKGHASDPMNDVVDRLANEAARIQAGRRGDALPTVLGEPDAPRRPRKDPTSGNPLVALSGWLVPVLGHRPPELGGYNPNPVADGVRRKLVEVLAGLHAVHPDLLVLTGLGLGAEQIGAEAAVEAHVAYAAVLAHPDPERVWPAASKSHYRRLLEGAATTLTLSAKPPTSRQQAGMAGGARDDALVAKADGAIVVWDKKDRRLGELVAALERRIPNDVWVISP